MKFKSKEEVTQFLSKIVRYIHNNSTFLIGGTIEVLGNVRCTRCGHAHREGTDCDSCAKMIISAFNTDDVQVCPKCGGMAVRRGKCHTCIDCGEGLGCS